MTTITHTTTSPATLPVGAVRRFFARAGSAVWKALEASGRARAARDLRAYAERTALRDPELSRQLLSAVEDLKRG